MLLTVDSVSKTYPGGRPVLQDLSLTLEAGETLALTGESGSGKSTLLNLAGALDHFDAGEIRLDGRTYSGLGDSGRAALRRDQVAIIFQQYNLVPSLNVGQNISLHARMAGRTNGAALDQMVDRLGLADLLERYPEQLSGGQQQRVAIGRAMAVAPKLLLADEPTGNLDETASQTVMEELLALVRDSHTALLLVTHSHDIAGQLDRRAHLTHGKIT
ncbi:MAG: ABC transporter ATP-binding protein [Pseudomonadota bacterium]